MFPAQTSLIPVQIVLARFWESQGWQGLFVNYPYWYLGTTPYRYLTGPILPGVLALIHRLVPNFSLFEVMLGVIVISWVLGGVGVYLFIRELGREGERARGIALFSGLFYLFGPIVPFLFRFSDGLYLITFSFLPYVLLLYLRLLKNWTRKLALFLSISISFIILLDSLILPSLLLGMAAVFLAQTGWKRAEEKLKQSLLLIACSLLLATFWYTPGYWWTLLQAPSFGGKGLALVIIWLGKLLPIALALTAAIFSVRFFKKKDPLRDFTFYWLFIFGFLTLIRFLSDPDFWLDWSSYGVEMQMGIAIALGVFFEDRRRKSEDGSRRQMTEGKQKISFPFSVFRNLSSVFNFRSSVFFALYILIFAFIANKYLLGTFQKDISQTVEYRIGRQLSEIANPPSTSSGQAARVFLSGTTAFWLNAFFDISQVRGGRDQVAVDPTWRQAVWEVRDGTDPQKTIQWLRELGVSYLVVHTKDSEEFYHDFVYPEKFESSQSLKKIYKGNGDIIYQVLE